MALLSRHQIVVGSVRSYRQVLQSKDVQASGLLVDAHGTTGQGYPALALPYRLGDSPRAVPHAAPACGADTDRLLGGLGFTGHDIDAFRSAGVVA